MDKEFYKSKKFWTAVVTAAAVVVLYFTGKEQLAELITVVGTGLIGGFGLADMGKERALSEGDK